MTADPHPQESLRIDALRELDILDTVGEKQFDELVALASSLCNAPISLISLVDADRQWFKARTGLDKPQTSLQESVCAHAILCDEILVIADTRLDPRTCDNPLVHNEVNMQFYAGVPLRTEHGLPIGTLCVLDTVPRSLTEIQLQALKVLGRQVMARITLRKSLDRETHLNQQLQRQRNELLQMNEKLSNADNSKNLFLAMMAHELRNPLSALSNGLSLLDTPGTVVASEQETVFMMQRQCHQLTRLLDDLLDISRISRGKISLHRSRVELGAILGEALATLNAKATAKQQQLSHIKTVEPILILADPARMLQVIVNLIDNAIRYTPVGGKIWLSCELESGLVVVSIKDTGKGISELDRERIFKLFVQLQGADGSSSDGLGLGLSLVHELVQLHGGEVEVVSDGIGLGSTFSIRLPLAPAVENTPQQQHSFANNAEAVQKISESQPNIQSTSEEDCSVLITDDNLDSIRALGRLLQRRGYRVELTGSGSEALQAIKDRMPDVLLLDIGLPDMTGYDVARQIRQRADGRAILLIAITGYGQPEDRFRSEQAGFDHHLIKPVLLEQLHDLIQQHRKCQTSKGA